MDRRWDKRLAAAIALTLAACASTETAGPAPIPPPEPTAYLAEVRGKRDQTLNAGDIELGIKSLEARKLPEASRAFNRALKYDPTNAGLHFLNGLTYHLMAADGDTSRLEFAKIGYEQSLKFDPANAWAAYQKGLVEYRLQAFGNAQDSFAYAASFLPDNREVLTALTAASYQLQDLRTATTAMKRLVDDEQPDSTALRNAVVVFGAAGEFSEAETSLSRLASLEDGSAYRRQRLQQRLSEWRRLHERLPQLAQANILADDNATEGLTPSASNSDNAYSGSGSSAPAPAAGAATGKTPRMVLADVVIIHTQELATSRRGFNLLDGLQLQYQGNIVTYSYNNNTTTGDPRNYTRSHALTVPAVTYNLNIFNDTGNISEVLARPTLVATEGKKSEFFHGAVWHVELSSSAAAGVSGDVTDVPIGIRLEMTPTFIGPDKLQLDVTAARASIESRASEAAFNNFAQTTKTTVSANVVMDFEQTLVLSGLSEKESEVSRSGVPILQDLPIIQYAFSNKTTTDINNSVLILITPRNPRFTEADGSPKLGEAPPKPAAPSPNLARLNSRSDWAFKPAPNLDAVMNHLKDRRFFREFRAGDVTLEQWDNPDSLKYKILQAIDMIYF